MMRARAVGAARPLSWRLLAAVGLWLACACSTALAQSNGRSPLEITLVGAVGEDPQLEARIVSWFAGGRFELAVTRAAELERDSVLAGALSPGMHIWLTLHREGEARMYFVIAKRGQPSTYLLRDLHLEHGLDEVGGEQIAAALHLSSDALADGELMTARATVEESLRTDTAQPVTRTLSSPVPSVTQELARPAPVEKPSVSKRRAPPSWWFGLGYGAQWRDKEGFAHGPRASLGAVWSRFSVRLMAQAALPGNHSVGPVNIHLYGLWFALAPGFQLPVHARLTLGFYTGPAAAWVHVAPENSSDIVAARSANQLRPAWLLGLSLTLALERVQLALIGEGNLALKRTHYDLRNEDGTTRNLGGPGRFLPGMALEVRF